MNKLDWCKHEVTVPFGSSPHWANVQNWLYKNVNRDDFVFDRRYQMTGDSWRRTIRFAFEKDKIHFETMRKKFITLPDSITNEFTEWCEKNNIPYKYEGVVDYSHTQSLWRIPNSKHRVLALLRWA